MKSIKYELLGFSGMLGLLILILIHPSGHDEREALRNAVGGLFSRDIPDPR